MNRLGKYLKKGGRLAFDKTVDLQISFLSNLNVSLDLFRKCVSPKRCRQVIWVPLSSINRFVPNDQLEELFYPERVHKPGIKSFFWDGDWDRHTHPVDLMYAEFSSSYRSVMQIFRENRPFRECDEYNEKIAGLERSVTSVRGSTTEEIDNYFESLLQLEERIKTYGYKTQKQLNRPEYDEIGVFIGRDGSVIKAEANFSGTHRFAIAKHLGLDRVPVCILAIHETWAKHHIRLLGNPKSLSQYFSGRFNG